MNWFIVLSQFSIFCCLVLNKAYCLKPVDCNVTEQWDYVTVRPGARMFYWFYYTTSPKGVRNAPLILWLQGGPGQSSTGVGNFQEIGPLDVSLKNRDTTWLSEASLLFVDSPVGSGYSYVETKDLYCNSTEMIARDMITFLRYFFNSVTGKDFQKVPFYIMTESYGGKMTAVIAEQLLQAISENTLECKFTGVTLGASFIHPEVALQSWINFTVANSLIDEPEAEILMNTFNKVKRDISNKDWVQAFYRQYDLGMLLQNYTNYVNMYNMLQWDSPWMTKDNKGLRLDSTDSSELWSLMNGKIRNKLKIIPQSVVWGGQNESVYFALKGDFLKPVVNTVNNLVSNTNLQVAVYSGQLDIIVNTLGTLKWVSTLDIYSSYSRANRVPFSCPTEPKKTCGFVKRFENFSFFWIMDAGHMVPQDNGAAGLEMLKQILKPTKKFN